MYRNGDANMRSAWICTRNDVLGNLAVLVAALGVFGTGTGWPDVIVAAIMAALCKARRPWLGSPSANCVSRSAFPLKSAQSFDG
jgi:Co/Zn/Cd efflux system component